MLLRLRTPKRRQCKQGARIRSVGLSATLYEKLGWVVSDGSADTQGMPNDPVEFTRLPGFFHHGRACTRRQNTSAMSIAAT